MPDLKRMFGAGGAWPRIRCRGFIKNRDGATAIEFALLGAPFFMLVFAILETCVAFAAQQLLANATDNIAREFRTGQIKASDNIDEKKLREMVCQRISLLMPSGCPGLAVDLRSYPTFKDAADASPPPVDKDGNYQTTVSPGLALSKNLMRVYYKWPTVTNFVAKHTKDGKLLLFSANAWQNEPFNNTPNNPPAN